jgi:hypothetical protein
VKPSTGREPKLNFISQRRTEANMTSAAFGITYSLWRRMRWAIIAVVVLMLFLALGVQIFPAAGPYFCGASIVFLFAAAVFFLNAFTYGPADLGVKSSGFPTHMRVLPVTTHALVGWPMLFAAITFVLLWVLPSCLIFLPSGFPLPVLWPATMLVALCVWVQAIGWSPFPSPFARVPALIAAMTPLILPLALGLTFFRGPVLTAVVCVSCLVWSLAAYVFGVHGLSRARKGSEGDWLRPLIQRWDARVGRRQDAVYGLRPFRSAFTAQLWHECRRNAIVLPAMTAFVGLPLFIVLLLPTLSPDRQQSFVFGSTNVPTQVLILMLWVGFPLLFALTNGGGMAKLDIWGKTAMPSFFAVRPLTTTQFVLIKFCATALSVVVSWMITCSLFTVWAIVEASPLNPRRSIIRAALEDVTPRGIAITVIVVIGLVAISWRNIVSGMWPTLLGRKHLANAIGFAFMGVFGLLGCAGFWIYKHPDLRDLFWRILPWMIAADLALKLVVSIWLSVVLQHCGFVTRTEMNSLAAGWVLLAVCIVGILSMLVTPTWTLAAVVAFMLPFASLAAAPLALDWNRHR